jgi:hypothetical protein
MKHIFWRLMDMLRDKFPVDLLFMQILDLAGITIDPELVEIDRILKDDGSSSGSSMPYPNAIRRHRSPDATPLRWR